MSAIIEDDEPRDTDITDEAVAVPQDIELSSIAVEIALHPKSDVLAAGTIDGPVQIYSYTSDKSRSNHSLMTFRHHKESCRAVQFSDCGNYLFSGSSDKTINAIDLNAGAITRRLTVKNGAAIYCLLPIDEYMLASGDDDGKLIIWDFRRELPILSLKPCEEYISCLAVDSEHRTLLGTSGEGSISSLNLRSGKLEHQSELFTNEFLTVAMVKKESKIVVGASDGALNIFNFNDLSNLCDRFVIHEGSVDVVIPISDNVLCAGCEDGYIRAVEVLPNCSLGIVSSHDSLPVEGLSLSHDRQYLASCSYDQKVKFHSFSAIKHTEIESRVVKKGNLKFPSKERCFFKDLA